MSTIPTMNSTNCYHVGLLATLKRDGTYTAVFQYRRTIDELDCEILWYAGFRNRTKAEARRRLEGTREKVLADLNRTYPKKQFTNVRID